MPHPYLNLSESANYPGKYVVGTTARLLPYGSGLLDKSVKTVVIPPSFNGIEIAEIGHLSFYKHGITSVFIPKTIIRICQEAFENCTSLTEVKFEAGSKCEALEYGIFFFATSLRKIDFPASITSIFTPKSNFFFKVDLECFSYAGITDFSSVDSFFSNTPSIYVSNSYLGSTFAGKLVIRGNQACGVSLNQLKTPKQAKYSCIIRRINIQYQNYMFLLLQSC